MFSFVCICNFVMSRIMMLRCYIFIFITAHLGITFYTLNFFTTTKIPGCSVYRGNFSVPLGYRLYRFTFILRYMCTTEHYLCINNTKSEWWGYNCASPSFVELVFPSHYFSVLSLLDSCFSFFLLAIGLCVLRLTASSYPLGIFKLFFSLSASIWIRGELLNETLPCAITLSTDGTFTRLFF